MSVVSSQVLNTDVFRFTDGPQDGGLELYTEVCEVKFDDGRTQEKVVQMVRFSNHQGDNPVTAAFYMDGQYVTAARLRKAADQLDRLFSNPEPKQDYGSQP